MQAITHTVNPLGWLSCKMLRFIWPGCMTSGLNGFSLRDVPRPALPGPDWVLLRTRMGGICGSDLSIAYQKHPPNSILQAYCSQPMALGHENLALVEEAGEAVDDNWVGRRVVVDPTLACTDRGTEPPCARCAAGEYGACENFSGDRGGVAGLPPATSIGYTYRTGGSWGEYFVAHQSRLFAVDAAIPDEQAVVIDPLACSLHGVLRADLEDVETLLIYGAGIIGLGAIACLRALGYEGNIDVIGKHTFLRDIAVEYGADEYVILPKSNRGRAEAIAVRTDATVQRARFGNYMLSGGYDLTVDCIGSSRSTNEVLRWTRARGQVVMLGTLMESTLDLTPLWFRELHIVGAYGRQSEHFNGGRKDTYAIIHDWMREGVLRPERLLTHTFKLRDYRAALKTAMNKARYQAIKVAFDMR